MAGTTLFRKLTAADAPLLARHLLRLEPEDWRARFHGHVARDLATEHARRLDWARVVVIGGFCDGELRAVGELHPTTDGGACDAEIAVTVETGWQNRGIGTELLRRLINAARNRGLRRVCLLCLADNARIRHLVEKLEGSLHGDLGQMEGSIAPLPATFATLLEEGLEDGEALLARLRELSRRRAA